MTANTSIYSADHPIFEIQRGPRNRLQIRITSRGGKSYVDFRDWFVAADGSFQPSSRGVSIRQDQVALVLQGLGLAARALEGGVR
ncbi:hypothetical protein WM04_06875 [Burkholderia ubonensis]|uniref:transcriptional coactivator p15/PC4 family protein n=1 Tax=Burkholderia ubonensis TaxID=101571 RepID=UPI00075D2132|nr:transcriptional coactivator p15/PC4 family protein [Burkholderia ubonensis]KWI36354.1 hypothetical protein WM04_06875 [Burkholderia ubonensis]OJB15528.1 hypothetical protein BGV53_20095 [Burkholderia ubonensis]